jgi:hypothetical protein
MIWPDAWLKKGHLMRAQEAGSLRTVQLALATLICAALSACGGSGNAMGAGSATSNTPGNSTTATSSPAPPTNNSVTLSWSPPTQNSDGTPLTNLAGYTLHYGTASLDYTGTIEVTNPATTSYVLSDANFPAGTYYFAISAYNSLQVSSPLSSEIQVTVD